MLMLILSCDLIRSAFVRSGSVEVLFVHSWFVRSVQILLVKYCLSDRNVSIQILLRCCLFGRFC